TGSFKFRGAFNRISQIPEADRAAGVVAYSSGNHAQGVPKGFKVAEWLQSKQKDPVTEGLREVTAQLYPDLDSEGVMDLLGMR
ncbi:hypothetical protein LCGC14_2724020, partial [marine sediment metagenome]